PLVGASYRCPLRVTSSVLTCSRGKAPWGRSHFARGENRGQEPKRRRASGSSAGTARSGGPFAQGFANDEFKEADVLGRQLKLLRPPPDRLDQPAQGARES